MCFIVDRNATRPNTRTAWKIVEEYQDDNGRKYWGGYIERSFRYRTGREVIAKNEDGGISLRLTSDNTYSDGYVASQHGLYMFSSRNAALNYAGVGNILELSTRLALVKLAVKPSDWLKSSAELLGSRQNGARTYRRAKVLSITRGKL